MTWLWLIPTLVLLTAVAMLWVGLRGRRVDDHPICRNCGFDLFGRPEGSLRCAECGAELLLRRAIVQGRRVRRRWMIAVGVLLLGIGLSVGGGDGYAAYAISDLQPHKPIWWLISEMNGSDAKARNAAVAELSRRLAAGQLARRQSDAAVDAMLDIQADARQSPPRRPFTVAMGNVIEDERQAGA